MERDTHCQRRQRPLRNLCLFASLRRSRAMMETQHIPSGALETVRTAPKGRLPDCQSPGQEQNGSQIHCRLRREGCHRYSESQEESNSPFFSHGDRGQGEEADGRSPHPHLCPPPSSCPGTTSSSQLSTHTPRQPETQLPSAEIIPTGMGDNGVPSQLPIFSVTSEDDTNLCGSGNRLVEIRATPSHPPAQAQEEEKAGGGGGGRASVGTWKASAFRVPTANLFPVRGELSAVRARQSEQLATLRARGQESSYQYVMQEMALRVLEREELEYVVVNNEDRRRKGRVWWGRRKCKSADGAQDLNRALKELQRGLLDPVGLGPNTRFLGLTSDVLAEISLFAQGYQGGPGGVNSR